MKKAIFLILLFLANLFAEKNVLVLHSYHHGLEWTDDISRGLLDTLSGTKERVNLFFEYLDAKRNSNDTFFEETYKYLKLKHKNQKYDLIIVSDNKALKFINLHKDAIAPKTPVVFSGVNNFNKGMVSNLKEVTGVKESVEHEKTIDLASKIFPRRKFLLIILDDTLTAQRISEEVRVLEKKGGKNFEFIYFSKMKENELSTLLKEHSHDLIAYLLTYNIDKNGKFYSYKESIAHFHKLLGNDVPLIGSWSFFVNKGIIGGAITSGYKQGKIAGKLALKILFNGKSASNIPIVDSQDAIEYIGDFKYMRNFNVSKSKFPIGTKFINEPSSFIKNYTTQFVVIGFFLFLVLVIFISAIYLKVEENNILDKMNQELDEKVQLATKQLRENEKLFKFIADTSQNIIFLMNTNFELLYINGQFRTFAKKNFSEKEKELKHYINQDLYDVLIYKLEKLNANHVEDKFEYKDKKHGRVYKFYYFARLDADKEIKGYKVVIEDMTLVSKKIADLTHEVNNDRLTGLYNRAHFDEMSKSLFNSAKKDKEDLALLMIDIDHFKDINDNFGHFIGDEVLKKVASLFKVVVRKEDKVYRIGGEEFAIMLNITLSDALRIAEKIRYVISEETIRIDKNHFMITVSVGVSLMEKDDTSFSSLFKRSDAALYEAKRSGRNLVCQT